MTEEIESQFAEKLQRAETHSMVLFEELCDLLHITKLEKVLEVVRSIVMVERAMIMLKQLTNEEQTSIGEKREHHAIMAWWFNSDSKGCTCVVACKTNDHKQDKIVWCAYMSVVDGKNEDSDIYYTRDLGNKLDETIARGYFPFLKDYPYKDS